MKPLPVERVHPLCCTEAAGTRGTRATQEFDFRA
jgi:hypothetical protein